jgi:hypothetical protein
VLTAFERLQGEPKAAPAPAPRPKRRSR